MNNETNFYLTIALLAGIGKFVVVSVAGLFLVWVLFWR